MKKLLLPIATGLILTVTLVFWFIQNPEGPGKAPDISLNFINGQKIDINSLQGKPVLVTFWATTCSTCIKEIPQLIELYNQYSKDGFEIISIAMSYDPPNKVVELSERRNIPYPIALDIDGSAARSFGNIEITPTSFLIGPQGDIVLQKTGEINVEDLRTKVKELLQKNITTVS